MGLGTIAIYGCGGFGITSSRYWDRDVSPHMADVAAAAPIADIEVNYIDTSATANLKGDEDPDRVYVVQGMDGAGKIRRDSHKAFSEDNTLKQVLLKCPPRALNLVIFSLSGGTGNTIGTELMTELSRMGQNVIGIVAASSESATTIQNTMGAIKTLDYKARQENAFFTVAFEDNGDNADRAAVDSRVKAYIGALATLAAPTVRELDSADIANWLRPDRIPGFSVRPQLALLDIVVDGKSLNEIADPLSIASLITDPTETLAGVLPEYSTVGYHPDGVKDAQSFHYCISVDAVPALTAQLNAKLKDIADRRSARKTQTTIVSEDDVVDDSGFIW